MSSSPYFNIDCYLKQFVIDMNCQAQFIHNRDATNFLSKYHSVSSPLFPVNNYDCSEMLFPSQTPNVRPSYSGNINNSNVSHDVQYNSFCQNFHGNIS